MLGKRFAAGLAAALVLGAVSPAAAAVFTFSDILNDGESKTYLFQPTNGLFDLNAVISSNYKFYFVREFEPGDADYGTGTINAGCSDTPCVSTGAYDAKLPDSSFVKLFASRVPNGLEITARVETESYFACKGAAAGPCGLVFDPAVLNVSFRYDGSEPTVTVTDSPIPEPATWAMMIAGFGMAGAALRRRRELAA